ncbi:MAG: glycosyltransferase [Anaerolineaceae bacterium]
MPADCQRRQSLLVVSDTLSPDPNGVALIAMRTSELLSVRADVHLLGPAGARAPSTVRFTGLKRTAIGTADFRLPYPGPRTVARAVREADAVVVHTLGPLGCEALLFARRYNKHSTLFLHNDFAKLMRHTLRARAGRNVAEWSAGRIESWAVGMASRVVAPSSMAMPRSDVFRLDPPLYEARVHREHRAEAPLTVAYHGRISREKAVDSTVRAIADADPGHRRFRFRLIGDGSQLVPTLRLARELGVPVDYVPWCKEPMASLAEADIYVMASRTETYSMASLEALGCGVPVIARSVGEIPAYIRHGETGFLFESDRQMPELIRRLADDPALRTSIASRALAAATEKSVWQQFADASIAV